LAAHLYLLAIPKTNSSQEDMMQLLVRGLKWLVNLAIFFILFAFALNNQQDATVHFFFGTQLRLPMVLVVLAAFAFGLGLGILAMVPRWWQQRKAASMARKAVPKTTPNAQPEAASTAQPTLNEL
jgi:lipopolysaccharide assembly protein A